MRRLRRSLIVAGALAALAAATLLVLPQANAATGDGSPTDPNIAFVGRWDTSNAAAYIPNWAGAYFKTGFTGTTVKLKQRNTIDLYYSIDGGAFSYITNVSGTVNLTPTPLSSGNHTLRVSYRVVGGSYTGDAVFQGLTLDSGAKTLPAAVSPKLIEFVGDSITLGTTSTQTALTAYGWLTGEQLGAEHTQLGYGGGCLVATSDGCVSVAAQFLRTGYPATSALWDFTRYQANAVVINLGTNDKSHSVSSADFQSGYTAFLKTVRSKYPNAAIFALRTFSGRYPAETQAAVAAVTSAGDTNVTYVDTTGWIDSTMLSDSVHPNDAGHRAIAAKLAPIVAAKLGSTSASASPTASPSASASSSASSSPSASISPSASTSTTPGSAAGCQVSYTVASQWSGGFQGTVTVKNTGAAAVDGWALQWSFTGGQQVTQAWNATYTQVGTVVKMANATWNAGIPAGGSASFGFLANAGTTNPVPTAFTLNGTTCTVA